MRQTNRRLMIVGAILMAAAVGSFVYMSSIASTSNDPKALMEIVGEVSGVVGAIGALMIAFGIRGRKPA